MTANDARDSRRDRHARLRLEHRRHRLERRYRRLLALYPKDHRREHAEEMVGVLLAAAAHGAQPPTDEPRTAEPRTVEPGTVEPGTVEPRTVEPRTVEPRMADLAARARCSGQHAADCADLVAGALRIRGRMAVNRIRRAHWFAVPVRDPRWSDALAVVSVVAPLLLLVAALAEFDIPQATVSGMTGHPYWPLGSAVYVSDLPLTLARPRWPSWRCCG